MIKEASYYTSEGSSVHCGLCKHHCHIGLGMRGACMVRENQGGILHSHSYGNVIAMSADPVEKKPLFHVAPGSIAFSFAAEGCNFTCPWCQNHQISQAGKRGEPVYGHGHAIPPTTIVEEAVAAKARVVAATYTEPTIFYELAYEVAVIAREKGLLNAWVTNGSTAEAPLENIAPYLDAANVDLKGMDNQKTQSFTGMGAEKVCDTIRHMHSLGIWVEITTLLIPGFNDSPKELARVAAFIADLDPNIPWHITRYFPQYKYNEPPTPPTKLHLAQKLGAEHGLRYVYTGNLAELGGEDTYCSNCQASLIARRGHNVVGEDLTPEATCPHCNTPSPE